MASALPLAKLRLNPQPKIVHLPAVRRTLPCIDPDLRKAIRGLVSGELPWPLFLCGSTGTGKTCAALCVLDYSGGEYHTAAGFCDMMIDAGLGRLAWHNEGRSGVFYQEDIWKRISRAPLAVLDELGCRDKASDFDYKTVKRFIDDRQGKPLIVVSNAGLTFVAKIYDDRITSRLASGTVIRLEGKDQRIRKLWPSFDNGDTTQGEPK